MDIKYLRNRLDELDDKFNIYPITYKHIVFEERVFLNCFYCPKYNSNWTCPPHILKLSYKNIICEYANLGIVGITMNIKNNFNDVRIESTNKLHKALLMLEKELWEGNNPLATSFIGGSCKLCKDGCASDKCRQPAKARIPIEAIGINVIESLKNIDIDVAFPIKNKLSRYGMLLW